MSSSDEHVVARVAAGAVCGLAWAASLRSYMAAINPAGSTVDWVGTFVGILLPGVLVGACLGAACALGSNAGRATMRVFAASPLLFPLFAMLVPGALVALVTQGLGTGALLVALAGIAGGYALGGGRRIWARSVCGILAVAMSAAVAVFVPTMGGREFALTTPRGVWMTLLALSLMVVLCVAASIPYRNLSATATATATAAATETLRAGAAIGGRASEERPDAVSRP